MKISFTTDSYILVKPIQAVKQTLLFEVKLQVCFIGSRCVCVSTQSNLVHIHNAMDQAANRFARAPPSTVESLIKVVINTVIVK